MGPKRKQINVPIVICIMRKACVVPPRSMLLRMQKLDPAQKDAAIKTKKIPINYSVREVFLATYHGQVKKVKGIVILYPD